MASRRRSGYAVNCAPEGGEDGCLRRMPGSTRSLRSNEFVLEWPPQSGRTASFPEVDRAEWFEIDRAGNKILQAQRPFLQRLRSLLTSTT